MDISLPLNLNQTPGAYPALTNNTLDLKLNQVVAVQVVENQIALNSFTMNLAGSTIQVQAQQALNLQPGQTLQVQVAKLLPVPEFTIVNADPVAVSKQNSANGLSGVTLKMLGFANSANSQPQALLVLKTADGKATDTAQLGLKLNQVIDATVLNNASSANSLSLSVAGKTWQVQTQSALPLQNGAAMQLQVVKLQPQLEFNVLNMASFRADKSTNASPVAPPSQTSAAPNDSKPLVLDQKILATVVQVAGNKISLQLNIPVSNNTTQSNSPLNMTAMRVTVDAKQLILPTTTTPASVSQTSSSINSTYATSTTNTTNTTNTTSLAELLKPGNQISLQVIQTGKQPLFAVSIPEDSAAQTVEKITSLVKQLLPIQNSPVALLNNLSQALTTLQTNPTVAETLTHLAVQLLAQIPQQSQLADPLKLQQSLNQSGLFLEAKLAEWLVGMSSSPLTADLKANLLQFAQALKAQIHADVSSAELQIVLKDLLQNTHESLAKIAINQFNSLPSVDNAQQSWLLELPFFHQQAADTLQLQIQQRTEPENQAREATEHKNWAVSITLSPPDLGTIHCRVSSYDGVINTRFWSKSNDTVAIINQHLDYLHQQLEAKGLKTGFMEAHQGKPAKPDVINLALTHLLNEKV